MSLRLLHPFMPFLTEAIWQNLRPHLPRPEAEALIAAPWPRASKRWHDSEAEDDFGGLQGIVTGVRFWRRHLGVEPSRWIEVWVAPPYETREKLEQIRRSVESESDDATRRIRTGMLKDREQTLDRRHELLLKAAGVISVLGRARPVNVVKFKEDIPAEVRDDCIDASTDFQLFIPRSGSMDVEAERARLRREVDDAQAEVARLDAKLANEQFRTRAPAAVVGKEEEKLAAARARLEGLQSRLEELT